MPCRSLSRKALPRKPVASADAHTTTVNVQLMEPHAVSVACLNHWALQCRSSGRRNSSTGRSPSPGRPQNRQRRFSGNKPNKGRGRGREGNSQAEIYSQKARQWPWQRRRKTLQDECTNSYWSFRITTPSQS